MNTYKLINKFTLILSLFIVLILTTGMQKKNDDLNGKIFKNIYIEEVNIGKLQVDDAINILEKKYFPKIIYIKYEDKMWSINPKDIDLDYNIDEAVKKAYSYTRSDSKLDNLKKKYHLELNKQYNINLIKKLTTFCFIDNFVNIWYNFFEKVMEEN